MVVRRDGVLIPLDRNPLETFLLGLCVFVGVGSLLSPPPTAVPDWLAVAWYLVLTVGGLLGLVGSYLPNVILGVLMVRAALIPLGAVAYAVGFLLGWAGVAAVGFGLAAHWRAWQITRHLRGLR